MKARMAVGAAAAAALVGLAGCGGSSTSATTATVTTAPATTGTTAPTTSASSASTSSPSTTAAVTTTATTKIGRCTAADFAAALNLPGNGAAGTIYYSVTATNVSQSPCVTGGYFGVSTYEVGGHVISSQDVRNPSPPPRTFTVASQGRLTFTVGLSDVASGPAQCPRVGALHLIPPNDTHFVQLSLLDASGQGPQVVNCPGNLPVTAAVPG